MDLYPETPFGQARRTGGRHGYVAYFPTPIPRALDLPPTTVALLTEAEAALGRLAGVGDLLPNPDLLIRPYVLREAVSSTRIEGTQASVSDVFELEAAGGTPNADVEEVLGYVDALTWGLGQSELPLSVRLMRELHRRLMAGTRGRSRMPGELRTSQNWIGAPGSTIESARFVPPPPEELADLLSDWESFAHEDGGQPLLVQNALLHYQLETIHPFLDGNGRVGRLLIVFLLVARGRLAAPLLDISSYFASDRDSYYAALRGVSERGDAITWIDLFLRAIRTQAAEATARARRLMELRERYRRHAAALRAGNAIALVDLACEAPILTARLVTERLDVTRPTAGSLLRRLEREGLLVRAGSGERGQQRYVAEEVLAALADPPRVSSAAG
jgi:Fic family protein